MKEGLSYDGTWRLELEDYIQKSDRWKRTVIPAEALLQCFRFVCRLCGCLRKDAHGIYRRQGRSGQTPEHRDGQADRGSLKTRERRLLGRACGRGYGASLCEVCRAFRPGKGQGYDKLGAAWHPERYGRRAGCAGRLSQCPVRNEFLQGHRSADGLLPAYFWK